MTQSLLVLGAHSDIGLAIAHEFAQHGFDIQLAARRSKELSAIAEDLQIRYNIKVYVYEFDVLDYPSHQAFIDGLSTLPNIVACVVGLLGDQQQGQKQWLHAQQIIDTNFSGPAAILSRFANLFEQRHSGCIIGVSSVAGDRGRQSNYLYGSAKAGLSAFLSGLRNRLYAAGVQVITVKPGFVDTAMTAGMDLPKLLTARPEQVASQIYSAMLKQKHVVYSRWFWRWIMQIIKSIPESIFIKLSL